VLMCTVVSEMGTLSSRSRRVSSSAWPANVSPSAPADHVILSNSGCALPCGTSFLFFFLHK
jgi:hypothetical protein